MAPVRGNSRTGRTEQILIAKIRPMVAWGCRGGGRGMTGKGLEAASLGDDSCQHSWNGVPMVHTLTVCKLHLKGEL